MIVGHTRTARDVSFTPATVAATVEPTPAPNPAPTSAPAEGFGPATRVEIGSGSAAKPAAPASTGSAPTENVINIDDQTRTVVFQSRNSSTGTVIFQIPDESRLRLRAYLEEVAQHTAAATAGTHLDPSRIDSIRV